MKFKSSCRKHLGVNTPFYLVQILNTDHKPNHSASYRKTRASLEGIHTGPIASGFVYDLAVEDRE